MARSRALPFSFAVKNLTRSPVRTLATVVATACVAGLLAVTAAFVDSLDRGFTRPARDDVGVLLSIAAEGDVVRSSLAAGIDAFVAADVAGLATVNEVPAVSPELHVGIAVGLDGRPAQAYVRGVSDRAFLVHDAVTLVSGRPARSGEAIVGRLAAARLGVPASALAAGTILDVEGMSFCVVGEFAAGGSALEGEIWLPLHELRTALRRDDVSAVFVRMRSDADFAALELFARRRLDLESEAMRSSEFFERLARTYAPIGWMARVLASLVALAALVCGINVLSAAIAQRSGEIAVLRAIGYGPIAIAGGLALEAALVAGAGAALGLLLADVALAGQSIRVAMTAIELESSARSSAIALCATFALALGALIPAAYGSLTVPLATRLRGDG
ncbi:MAG: hypothetical protein IT459_14035 [Planctomycetes bacterium]|nr:hypothetical protein [Planctomycetota bacterium]